MTMLTRTSALDAELERVTAELGVAHVPGLEPAVVRDGEPVFCGGFGVRAVDESALQPVVEELAVEVGGNSLRPAPDVARGDHRRCRRVAAREPRLRDLCGARERWSDPMVLRDRLGTRLLGGHRSGAVTLWRTDGPVETWPRVPRPPLMGGGPSAGQPALRFGGGKR
jgi:hypothetical protein